MRILHQLAFLLFGMCNPFIVLVATLRCLIGYSYAAEIPLNSLGEQFYSKTLEIEWKLPTNQLPRTVRTFKVVPVKFSHAIISNLVSWGGFAESNRVWATDDGTQIDRNTFVYRKNGIRQWLVINPALGLAHLYNPLLSWRMPEGVPDESRSYELATNILLQLAISTNELILQSGKPRAWFYPGETTSREITHRSSMGIEFRRQLDNVPCVGECIHIDFEDHEQITQLEIDWRGLKPSKPYPVANYDQMTTWIKEGRARVQSFEGPMDARFLHASDIKRITIIGANAHYSKATQFIDTKEVGIGRLYPYAVLQADAELAPGDHETIWLYCPMIAVDLNGPSQVATNDIGFSVYPSKLRENQKEAQ